MSDLIDRQEIIDALDHVIKNGAKNKYFDGHFITAEAMKEYILAQPSAQPESCGDVISKEYLKEHIEACWINGRPRHAPELNELLSWIDDVPSAQPKSPCTVCQEFDCYGCKFRRTT